MQCLNGSYKNVSRTSCILGQVVISLYADKIIQVLDFDNLHTFKNRTELDNLACRLVRLNEFAD